LVNYLANRFKHPQEHFDTPVAIRQQAGGIRMAIASRLEVAEAQPLWSRRATEQFA